MNVRVLVNRSVNRKRGSKVAVYDRQATDLPINAIVAPVEIDDPFPSAYGRDKIIATRSLRDDPLSWMHSHGRVDDVEFLAGRRYQAALEAAEPPGAAGIDPTREYVDGGRLAEPYTDARRKAARLLALADAALGLGGARLTRMILGHRKFPNEVAAILGYVGESGTIDRGASAYYARRFKECLATIAVTI